MEGTVYGIDAAEKSQPRRNKSHHLGEDDRVALWETPSVSRTLIAVVIGLTAGVVGGMFGVGGGIIVVPGLVILLKVSQYQASGTSAATIVASSAAALVVLAGDGQVDWAAAALLFVGAGSGAWLATRWLHRVPEDVLAGVFTFILFVAGVRMWL